LWWYFTTELGWTKGTLFWVTAGMFVFGLWLVTWISQKIHAVDDERVTWDELVGYFTAALFIPAGVGWLWLAFGLFRYFDMWKPWPVNRFDLKQAPLWVMLDDVAGGILAGLMVLWFQQDWQVALLALAGHAALVLLTRLTLRYDRTQVRRWNPGMYVPSLAEAIQKPRSAWGK